MDHGIRFSLALVTGAALAAPAAMGAEPAEDVRTFARVFVALEAHDLHQYCEGLHARPYVAYRDRVCQSAVQNILKKPADCSPDRIAQQVKEDKAQCLAMPATEFEQLVARGDERRKAFVEQVEAQGIDAVKLFEDARLAVAGPRANPQDKPVPPMR